MSDPARRRGISPGSRRKQARTDPSSAQTPFPITDYFVRPSDPMGRSVTITITTPPDFRRIVSTVLTKELFAFQTEGDVIRWTIKHGLIELAKRAQDDELTSEANQLAGWLRIAATEDEHLYYVAVFRKVATVVRKLANDGHMGKAAEVAERVWSTVDKVKDKHWREVYRTEMKKLLDEMRRAGGNGAVDVSRLAKKLYEKEHVTPGNGGGKGKAIVVEEDA